jgi:hypothetical protein
MAFNGGLAARIHAACGGAPIYQSEKYTPNADQRRALTDESYFTAP